MNQKVVYPKAWASSSAQQKSIGIIYRCFMMTGSIVCLTCYMAMPWATASNSSISALPITHSQRSPLWAITILTLSTVCVQNSRPSRMTVSPSGQCSFLPSAKATVIRWPLRWRLTQVKVTPLCSCRQQIRTTYVHKIMPKPRAPKSAEIGERFYTLCNILRSVAAT